ncbi:MAG: glycosyltransferase [Planctomycetes bacterium]|nr:glycosyltransferase [Planctomycetota bacterium]
MGINAFVFNPPWRLPVPPPRVPSGYCQLTHAVVEGLVDLGVETTCLHHAVYAVRTGEFRATYDLYLVEREPHTDTAAILERLDAHGCLARTAFIDSHDRIFGVDSFWLEAARAYFKSDARPGDGTVLLPHGIQNRYLPAERPRAGRDVFFVCNDAAHGDRPKIRQELLRGGWSCQFGPLLDEDDVDPLHRALGPYHNARYYRGLNQCRVAINARGGQPDCFRYWEIAGSFAVLVSFAMEEEYADFPDPPHPDVHYVRYAGPEDVARAVRGALDHAAEFNERQREFFLSRHRSRHRAARVLEVMGLT